MSAAWKGDCYRPRYLSIRGLNYLGMIRHGLARIVAYLITWRDCRLWRRALAYPPLRAPSGLALIRAGGRRSDTMFSTDLWGYDRGEPGDKDGTLRELREVSVVADDAAN